MQLSRRKLLTTLGVAASTVLLSNCMPKTSVNQSLPITPEVKVSDIPEVQSVRLGIIPSLEIAPILVAQNKKLFAKL